MSSSTADYPRERALWEREYEEVHAYTTSYRDELDRGVQFLLGWCGARGLELPGPILECACGRGRNLIPLARMGHSGVGLDHAVAALSRFRDRARGEESSPTVCARHDLREPLPVADRSVGTVLDITAVDNLTETRHRSDYADEIRRALRPGGLFVVVTFDRDDGYYARFLADGSEAGESGVVRDPNTGIHNRLFRADELVALFGARLERLAAQRFDFVDEAAQERWMRRFHLQLYRKAGGAER